jgi:hypothetical protein
VRDESARQARGQHAEHCGKSCVAESDDDELDETMAMADGHGKWWFGRLAVDVGREQRRPAIAHQPLVDFTMLADLHNRWAWWSLTERPVGVGTAVDRRLRCVRWYAPALARPAGRGGERAGISIAVHPSSKPPSTDVCHRGSWNASAAPLTPVAGGRQPGISIAAHRRSSSASLDAEFNTTRPLAAGPVVSIASATAYAASWACPRISPRRSSPRKGCLPGCQQASWPLCCRCVILCSPPAPSMTSLRLTLTPRLCAQPLNP